MEYYLTVKWHIAHFNSGYEIRYINEDNISGSIPLELGDEGHCEDLEFTKYLVTLHNNKIISHNMLNL